MFKFPNPNYPIKKKKEKEKKNLNYDFRPISVASLNISGQGKEVFKFG